MAHTQERNQTFHEVIGLVLLGLGTLLFLALISYTPRDVPTWFPLHTFEPANRNALNFIGPLGAILACLAYSFLGAAAYLLAAVLLGYGGAKLLTPSIQLTRQSAIWCVSFILSAACSRPFVEFHPRGRKPPQHCRRGRLAGQVVRTISPSQCPRGGRRGHRSVRPLSRESHPAHRHSPGRGGAQHGGHAGTARRALCVPGERRAPMSPASWQSMPSASPASAANSSDPLLRRGSRQQARMVRRRCRSKSLSCTRKMKSHRGRRRRSSTATRRRRASAKRKRKRFRPLAAVSCENYELPSLDLLDPVDRPEHVRPPTPTNCSPSRTRSSKRSRSSASVFRAATSRAARPSPATKSIPPTACAWTRSSRCERDIARATRAERINILAPIPGKDTVGIEIANAKKQKVTLRELLESDDFHQSKAKIPIALGKDVYGKTIIADLAAMPHGLVAGTTGSGKSVCINAIIAEHPLPLHAGGSALDHDRPESRRDADLQHPAAPRRPGRHRSEESAARPALGDRRDGKALRDLRQDRRAQHRQLQRPAASRRSQDEPSSSRPKPTLFESRPPSRACAEPDVSSIPKSSRPIDFDAMSDEEVF